MERRLAAILAADVAGYSRLMGTDEEGTARTLLGHRRALEPLIASYAGRIVKTTGDGLLLEFPSIVAAIECAQSMQEVMAKRNAEVPERLQMLFRIGVNLGDVLIDGDDILGDGVNIAARLESISEPGGICISASAYDHVQGKLPVEFDDIGFQSLKNISKPIRAYRLRTKESVPPERSISSVFDKPSIAVLPFRNASGDDEQEYFAEGIRCIARNRKGSIAVCSSEC